MDQPTNCIAVRRDGLVVKEVDGEIIVYDVDTDKVHLLSAVASQIWRAAASGAVSFTDLVAATSMLEPRPTEDDLLVTIEQLRAAALLDTPPNHDAPLGIDRRRLLKILGASAVLAPAITTILAPPAAATHSGAGGTAWGQTAALGCTHCRPVAPATDGICGTDGLCGVCISNQASACGGAPTADSQTRCCTGNACTSVGATGNRCCQPTGGAVGSGVCCATNSGGNCVATPLNSVPTILDASLCAIYTDESAVVTQPALRAGDSQCCLPTGTKTRNGTPAVTAVHCCSGVIAGGGPNAACT